VSEIYDLLRLAVGRRRPVAAIYDGLLRLLCPHVLGRKSGRLHAFCYQFGGGSHSGLSRVPKRMGEWRCLAVEKLSQVELRVDAWHTEPRSPRQTCIDESISTSTLSRKKIHNKGSKGAPQQKARQDHS